MPTGNPFLNIFLPNFPAMIVWLVGLVIAILRWRQHPQVSLLVVLAVLLFFLDVVAGAWIAARLPFLIGGQGRLGLAMLGLGNALQALLSGTVVVLVLWAIFGWRGGRV